MNEDNTGVGELGNIAENSNILGEITGVEDNKHCDTESIPEEQNAP